MVKIVVSGDTKFLIMCPQCNCIFEYERSDIHCSYKSRNKKIVNCPDCKSGIEHSLKHRDRAAKARLKV